MIIGAKITYPSNMIPSENISSINKDHTMKRSSQSKSTQNNVSINQQHPYLQFGLPTGDIIKNKVVSDGLKWEKDCETLADGNCFYHAICQQLQRPDINAKISIEKRNLNPKQLRQNVAEFVINIYNKLKTYTRHCI